MRLEPDNHIHTVTHFCIKIPPFHLNSQKHGQLQSICLILKLHAESLFLQLLCLLLR